LMMGFGFPTGMKLVSAIDDKLTPWLWGVNGAAGVFSSVVAVILSITFGIGTTLILGAICYLLLIPAAFVIGFEAKRDPTLNSQHAGMADSLTKG